MTTMEPKAWIAVAIAVACLFMLLRLVIGAQRRARLDRWWRQTWGRTQQRARLLWHWRSSRKVAAQAAQDAIERARRTRGTQEGNVYTPDAFKGPRKPH